MAVELLTVSLVTSVTVSFCPVPPAVPLPGAPFDPDIPVMEIVSARDGKLPIASAAAITNAQLFREACFWRCIFLPRAAWRMTAGAEMCFPFLQNRRSTTIIRISGHFSNLFTAHE
jgi:hypothetical protein